MYDDKAVLAIGKSVLKILSKTPYCNAENIVNNLMIEFQTNDFGCDDRTAIEQALTLLLDSKYFKKQ